AQFMYRRSEAPRLSSFIEESKKESIEEEDEYDYDDHEDHDHSLSDSQTFQWPRLSDQNEARLRSCLEEIHSVIGDSVPQHILVDTVMKCDFDLEKALDAVLSLQVHQFF
ncbi:PREDICTED: HBS1-like protein, partial [Branchiostoma belcheri]|uniref:HBS1-like protein n=1 Tax=Branchiostoma belcheri TaxID=7741 RepID=A0A6P4Y3I1_BRABE